MNLSRAPLFILISLSFLFLNDLAYCQKGKITGKIISANDSLAVPYVGINVISQPTGAITNAEGRFILSCSPQDTVLISHLNYESRKIALASLNTEGYTISIVPKVYLLDEVAIQTESIAEMLKKSISTSREGLGIPMRLETYYREFVKVDNHYTKFSDGLLHYDLLGNTSKSKSKVCVLQSRAKEIPREADTEMDWDLTSPLDVGKALNPFLFEKLEQVTEDADKFNFQILSRLANTDKDQLEIRYSPKPDIQEALYQGIVVIDKSTKYILSFSCELDQDPLKPGKEKNFILLKGKITQYSLTTLYQLSGTNYQPWYTGLRIGLRLWNNKKFDHTLLFMSDLAVNKLVGPPFELITNKAAYNKKALYSLGNNYKFDFWKDQNTIQLTGEEEKIIEQLQ